ncbi:hypothetical protein [Natronorubrum sp. DTA7]|uniref:hypothetical protein n=1 Tax=Natronorubrum sp. DTA7 TaxID=3447016 RepID=UPI003F87B8BE
MPSVQDFRDGLADESLRTAILAGLAAVPFVVFFSWEAVIDDVVVLGGSISFWVLALAAVYVGYRYSDHETSTRRAGFWTGLAGSLGTVLVYVANTITTIQSLSPRWAVITIVATPFVAALGVGITALLTMLIAQFVGWVTTRLARDRRRSTRSGADEHVTASRWWLPVAAYAVLAPVVFGSLFWQIWAASGDVWLVVSLVGTIGLFGLSTVALVSLFVDATAPRDEGADWVPNALLYAGVPLGAYALAHLMASLWMLENPPGYGMYAFLGALWLTSVVYLTHRHRYVGTLSHHFA